jgi:hypothetical protein
MKIEFVSKQFGGKMPQMIRRTSVVSALLAVSFAIAASDNVLASPAPVEYMKYFSPLPQKNYVNESQDRIIKKKSFKLNKVIETKAVANKEQGFFAIVPNTKLTDLEYVKGLLENPKVNGISATIPWKMVEPGEGEFDWSAVDNLLSSCEKNQKYLILRISTSGVSENSENNEPITDTPKWVFDTGVKSITYIGANNKEYKMPIYWDDNYMAQWSNFIRQFGSRYDKNPYIHSIGITGGGDAHGTCVTPNFAKGQTTSKEATTISNAKQMVDVLKKDHGMTPKQLVEHWQYVVDAFAKRFQHTRLNLNINPPIANRGGEDLLDHIVDYAVYKYGQRVYVTRENEKYDRHGFDDYRVLLKFRNDTITGLQLSEAVSGEAMTKIARYALDDGISFIEIPENMLTSKEEATVSTLDRLSRHLGYKLISGKAQLPTESSVGQPLAASFEFANMGDSSPLRPERQMDKDLPVSYKIQIELRDSSGKPIVQSLHTPSTPTNKWLPGGKVSWQVDLKMPELATGEYTTWMSIVDPISKQKVKYINGTAGDNKLESVVDLELGKLKIVPKTSAAAIPKTTESTASKSMEAN